MKLTLSECFQQEKEYELDRFDSKDAYKVGLFLCDYLFKYHIKLCFKIVAYGRVLFEFSSDECTPDNSQWLDRKINTVLHFHVSTQTLGVKLNQEATLLSEKYGLDESKFTLVSGGVPIKLKGQGVIGALAISGQAPLEDHHLAVMALNQLIH